MLAPNLNQVVSTIFDPSERASWKGLLDSVADHSLPYFHWEWNNPSRPRVEFPDDVHKEGFKDSENALVAQFVERIANFNVFQKTVSLQWGEGVVVRHAVKNLFIIQFPNSEARDEILERGP